MRICQYIAGDRQFRRPALCASNRNLWRQDADSGSVRTTSVDNGSASSIDYSGNPMNQQEETLIVEAVLQGDVSEFRALVERYQKPIYSLMMRLTGSADTAEDLTQEVFVRAFEKLHKFRRSRRFFPWLYTIAVNRGRDHLRRRGVRRDLFAEEPENFQVPDPSSEDCSRQQDCMATVTEIADAMTQLPPKYREPLLLYYREAFSVREIAEAMAVSDAAVKVRLHRGRNLIRRIMGVDDDT
jgi:RNA polymerase sigma-70 factor (ECF subfamily)